MILIIGIPNSGKTTYSLQYSNVIHFDNEPGLCRDIYKNIIEKVSLNNNLVIEGVYARIKDREELVKASKIHNTCIWINTPLETCLSREDEYRHRGQHLVIWAAEAFEPPTLDEGWDEIIIISGEDDIQHIIKE